MLIVSKAAKLHDFKLGLVDAELVVSDSEGENRETRKIDVKIKLAKVKDVLFL